MNLGSPGDGKALADKAVEAADHAIRALRARGAPVANRFADTSSEWAHRGLQAMREGSRQVRDGARRASEGTVGYVRQEPVKSLLIAAAVGAVVALLLGRRSRD